MSDPVVPVHEIAVRVVKHGRDAVFASRRASFITKLKSQSGVGADRELESFFALPARDERPVFVGMTTYESLSAVNRVQMNPLVMLKFLPFFLTMDLKAYGFFVEVGEPSLNLATLATGPGNVLHVAVRRVAAQDQARHAEAQARFLELLLVQPGVVSHHELRAVKGMGSVEGVTAGLTVFADDEAMADAYDALSEHEAFFAYVSTFETLASQFTRPTTSV